MVQLEASCRPITEKTATKISDHQVNAFDSSTWWYDLRGFGILKFAYRGSLSRQIRFFEENMGTRHLEVPIGTGTLFRMILSRRKRIGKLPAQITGADYSPQMLEGAKRKFARYPGFKALVGDIVKLPLPDHSFDSANIPNSLHCFPDANAALAEMHRVLVPGGSLAVNALLQPRGSAVSRRIACAINDWGLKNRMIYWVFQEDSVLDALEKTGFRIRCAFVENNCLFVRARA